MCSFLFVKYTCAVSYKLVALMSNSLYLLPSFIRNYSQTFIKALLLKVTLFLLKLMYLLLNFKM